MTTDLADKPLRRASGDARKSWLRTVSHDALCAALLAVCCLGIGAAANSFRRHPLPWAYRPPPQRLQEAVRTLGPSINSNAAASRSPVDKPRTIDLEAFQAFASGGTGIVIDARASAFYRQGHVPGALNLPRETFAADYARQKGSLETRKTAEVVVYCSDVDCPDAGMVADALAQLGFSRVLVYAEGWEEWARAGLPQEGRAP